MGINIQGFLNITPCRLVNWHYLAVESVLQARKFETSAPMWNFSFRHSEVIRGAQLAQDKDRRMIS